MNTLHIYLTFNGNTEEAFLFYQSIFGGEFDYVGRFGDIPSSDEFKIAEEDAHKIMHISYDINGMKLMGSDTTKQSGEVNFGNNMSISVNAASKEEADKIFNRLAEGGKVTMPIADTFWGAYFGMLTDRFGIHWMMNFDYNPEH